MSCVGCSILGLGCGETCMLRACMQSIASEKEQANAVTFLISFFGQNKLISLIFAVPDAQRSVLFRSLLMEACGRAANPVDGAVGLIGRHKINVCLAAVQTVLDGGIVTPIPYTPHPPPDLTLSVGLSTTNPESGSSSGNEETKLLNLFV